MIICVNGILTVKRKIGIKDKISQNFLVYSLKNKNVISIILIY